MRGACERGESGGKCDDTLTGVRERGCIFRLDVTPAPLSYSFLLLLFLSPPHVAASSPAGFISELTAAVDTSLSPY